MSRKFLLIIILQLVVSCAPLTQAPEYTDLLAYYPQTSDTTLLSRFHPIFIIEKHQKLYNRIGTPKAELLEDGNERIFVDPGESTVYAGEREFETATDKYTNLIYRIHFPKTPYGLFPFQIGAGDNVGLLVIITLNSSNKPVLYTTVHTCGCYLAFIPTTYLPASAYPPEWPENQQMVYTETLPSLLDPKNEVRENFHLMIKIKTASHRIKDLWFPNDESSKGYATNPIKMRPLVALEKLSLSDSDRTTSFYETSGKREGYVKGSYKPIERLLISWWAYDWKVGEDKKLSDDKNDPPIFYTSLKPWDRNASDMRNFPTFLAYWGWKL